jgi:hypothetical protein
MEKRYQVFISSTYADLKEERRAVTQTVIELDCIPAGMELFPAADEEQMAFIKRVIDDCDYYLLIIGGRYGSVSESGISYTEQEYDYAISKGLRVIALLHENPEQIALGKSEKDPGLREKLQTFRAKAAQGRLVKFWNTSSELPGLVALSLSSTIKMFPAVGWVRANRAAREDVLNEINELRKQNASLEDALAKAAPRVVITDLAGLDETVQAFGHYRIRNNREEWTSETTWRQMFGYLSPYLAKHPNEDLVKLVLGQALFKASGTQGHSPELDDQFFQTLGVQLKALGLVRIDYSETVQGGMAMFWTLTGVGERLMFELRTVRRKPGDASSGSRK